MPESVKYQDWIDDTSRLSDINDILRTSWLRTAGVVRAGVVMKHKGLNVPVIPCDSEEKQAEIIEDFWSERFEFGKPFIKYAVLLHPDNSWDMAIKMNHAVYHGTLLRIFDDHWPLSVKERRFLATANSETLSISSFSVTSKNRYTFWAETMKDKHYTWPKAESPKSPLLFGRSSPGTWNLWLAHRESPFRSSFRPLINCGYAARVVRMMSALIIFLVLATWTWLMSTPRPSMAPWPIFSPSVRKSIPRVPSVTIWRLCRTSSGGLPSTVMLAYTKFRCSWTVADYRKQPLPFSVSAFRTCFR
jgi:hypothetical protein